MDVLLCRRSDCWRQVFAEICILIYCYIDVSMDDVRCLYVDVSMSDVYVWIDRYV